MTQFNRSEVEEAYHHFVAVGDSGDWNAWADLHTEDGVWLEHAFGEIQGRESIRATINKLMAPVPMMVFPVEWWMIEGNRVVFYPWQVMPDPKGQGAVYRFGCITILEYAGNGEFSFQEDLYNPREGETVIKSWMKAGGQFAADAGALGMDSD